MAASLTRLVIIGAKEPSHEKIVTLARVLDVDSPDHIFFFDGTEKTDTILSSAFRKDDSSIYGYATKHTEAIVTRDVVATDRNRMKLLGDSGIKVGLDYATPDFDSMTDIDIANWYRRDEIAEDRRKAEQKETQQQPTKLTIDDLISFAASGDITNGDEENEGEDEPETDIGDISAAEIQFDDKAADDAEAILESVLGDTQARTEKAKREQEKREQQRRAQERKRAAQKPTSKHGDDKKPSRPHDKIEPQPKKRGFITRATGSTPPYLRALSPAERAAQDYVVKVQNIMAAVAFSGGEPGSRGKIIFVTSGKGGTGKTTVSWCLAAAFAAYYAATGRKDAVCLVEADYRSPKFQRKLNIPNTMSINNIARTLTSNDEIALVKDEVRSIISSNLFYDTDYDINYLACAYETEDVIDTNQMTSAIVQSVKYLANTGATVIIDGGIFSEKSYSLLDSMIVSVLAHDIIVVGDATSVDETDRTLRILATGGTRGRYTSSQQQRVAIDGIRVVMNRANLKSGQVQEFQNAVSPFKVIAALPDVPDLSPANQSVLTQCFVKYLPKGVQRALVNRMGQSLRDLGFSGSVAVFRNAKNGNGNDYEVRPNLFVRLFGNFLRK